MKMKKMCLLVLLMFALGIFMIACTGDKPTNNDNENQSSGK